MKNHEHRENSIKMLKKIKIVAKAKLGILEYRVELLSMHGKGIQLCSDV